VHRLVIALAALGTAACGATIGGPATDPTKDVASVAPADDASIATVEFGVGEGFTLAPLPKLEPIELPAVTMIEIDLALMKKLRAASDAELDPSLRGEARAVLWESLATHLGSEAAPNPFVEIATKRAADWRGVSAAESKRELDLARLKEAFIGDKAELAKLIGDEKIPARRAALRVRFDHAYMPYQEAILAMGIAELDRPEVPVVVTPEVPPKTAVLDPLGKPAVRAQTALFKADVGAHAQSFSVDSSEDLMSSSGLSKPTFDVSGLYVGGQAAVNVAQVSDLAIGLLAFGRYHVTTALPDNTFVSGEEASLTVAPDDAGATGAFVAGGGVRVAGNVFERLGMNFGLTVGYQQFLAPEEVPGCGKEQLAWDAAMRGVQAELFVGGEFYPLAMLSLGISGRLGFGHVSGEWCVPGGAIDNDPDTDDTPVDVSADSFSVGAQGEVGVHF
jgi:hypothetical protein